MGKQNQIKVINRDKLERHWKIKGHTDRHDGQLTRM